MIRLLIYGGLIALFACTSKPGIKEPTTISSSPDSTINTSFASDCTRVDWRAVTRILKEQKLKRASNPKGQTAITKKIPNTVMIRAILSELDTKPLQEHNITGSNDTTICLQEGTIIKIPSNAFITKRTGQKPKGKVRLMVKEYYSLSDILFANLTTTTKAGILETGGMIYINAYAGNDTLALEREIEISCNLPGHTSIAIAPAIKSYLRKNFLFRVATHEQIRISSRMTTSVSEEYIRN